MIEELLQGPEISVLAFSDGYTIVPLPAAQDHKRIGEGDTGLNTGGMGAYAPAPVATPAIMDRIMTESLRPTIDGMRREGISYLFSSPSPAHLPQDSLSSASSSQASCSLPTGPRSWNTTCVSGTPKPRHS